MPGVIPSENFAVLKVYTHKKIQNKILQTWNTPWEQIKYISCPPKKNPPGIKPTTGRDGGWGGALKLNGLFGGTKKISLKIKNLLKGVKGHKGPLVPCLERRFNSFQDPPPMKT